MVWELDGPMPILKTSKMDKNMPALLRILLRNVRNIGGEVEPGSTNLGDRQLFEAQHAFEGIVAEHEMLGQGTQRVQANGGDEHQPAKFMQLCRELDPTKPSDQPIISMPPS